MSNDDRNVGVVISDIARLMRTEFDRLLPYVVK